MPLNLDPLPTGKVDGDQDHTAGHNATNTAVNTIAEYVDDLELGAGAVTSVNSRTGAVTGLAEASDLTTHAADTTDVHGIADTSALATTAAVAAGYQPLDADLTAVAGLAPSNDDLLQRKAGAWTNRTVAQVKTDLGLAAVATSGSGDDITTGTVADARIASTIARDSEVTSAI